MAWKMTEAEEGDDVPQRLTEPEIIRTLAVGGFQIRARKGTLYLECWEELDGEQRLGSRLALTPEMAVEMAAAILKRFPGKH